MTLLADSALQSTATGLAATPPESRAEASGAHPTGMLIERALALFLFGLLVLGVIVILRPLATSILFGAVFAIATWPLRAMLVRVGFGRGLTASVLLIASLLLVAVPALLLAPSLAAKLTDAAHRLQQELEDLSDLPPGWVSGLPLVGDRLARVWIRVAAAGGDFRTLLEPYAEWLQSSAVGLAKGLADSVLQVLLSLIVAAMFWVNGDIVGQVMRELMGRLGGRAAVAALDAAGASLRSVAYGVVGTAIAQGILMSVGALIAGVPAPGLLGFIVMLLAISQVGAPLIVLVWGGAGWLLFHQAQTLWGVFILVWGLLLVSTGDNLIRPWLISQGVKMPLALVILGVFGGFLSLGFLGLFVGPALLAAAFNLLRSWRAHAL